MRTRALAVVVLVAALAVPTAAVAVGEQEEVGPVTLESTSPYATVEDGELRVAFEDLNDRATTTTHDVFRITAGAGEPVRVWVTVEAEPGVTAYRGDDPSATLGGESTAVTLSDGESLPVGFEIDTYGANPDSGTVTVHAEPVETETATEDGGGSGGGGSGDGADDSDDDTTATPAGPALTVVDADLDSARSVVGAPVRATATVENRGGEAGTTTVALTVDGEQVAERRVRVPAGASREVAFERSFDAPGEYEVAVGGVPAGTVTVSEPGGVEVVFGDGTTGGRVTERSGLPEVSGGETRAVISGGGGDGPAATVRPGERVNLSAAGSVVGSTAGLGTDRALRIVDVAVPPEREGESATVRMGVDRAAFEGGDPADARLAQLGDDGWTFLETRVADRTDETVVLAARTDEFGTVAAFASSGVTYEWTLPDGTTVAGDRVRPTFETPGRYELSLEVTDAAGNRDRTSRSVLVNDRPSVRIEAPGNSTAGEPTTLRANVTNEFGNTTVTWTFGDGSTATGLSVTRSFASGEVVEVQVTDEYGASARAERTMVTGSGPGGSPSPSFLPYVTPLDVPVPAFGGLVAVGVVAAAFVFVRSGLSLPGLFGGLAGYARALARSGPRITALSGATWDPEGGWIRIDELRVEADGLLETVEIVVTDGDGAEIVRKTIETESGEVYSASPERIRIPGGLDVDGGTFGLQVRAVDARQRTGVRNRSQSDLLEAEPSGETV
ncbi:PKD domain-containing protein [Haloglomus litoreum]|uniref:PKD domain-containing protein n=1 Tax=Haloglomus litoreum TaxID=3034026 RepID=UPI0023E7F408|nr:PKD domain-containing protein [Haloglomus sp. DT116]